MSLFAYQKGCTGVGGIGNVYSTSKNICYNAVVPEAKVTWGDKCTPKNVAYALETAPLTVTVKAIFDGELTEKKM